MAQYEQRIATRISRDADARLRFAAFCRRKSMSAFLTELILGVLPPAPPEVAGALSGATSPAPDSLPRTAVA